MNALREIEEAILAEGRERTGRRLEEKLQQAANALAAVCPRSGRPLRDTRWRDLQLHTVAGVIGLRVRHGYSEALDARICPARTAWGPAASQRMSPELEARVRCTATAVGSYEGAAAAARRRGSPVGDDLIPRHVQSRGTLAQATPLPSPVVPAREAGFNLVIVMDGWMARERGPDRGASPCKKAPERIARHEIKSAVIDRLEPRAGKAGGRGLLPEKFIVACPPGTSPVDFGAAVRAEARRRGLGRAKVVRLVMDGAAWLWDLAEARFRAAVKTPDCHHAGGRLRAVGRAPHGEQTPQTAAWVEPLLHRLRHGGQARVVRQLQELIEPTTPRGAETQQPVEREANYFKTPERHMNYSAIRRAGAPIGSGAVESLGAQLRRRFRCSGRFWQRPGLSKLPSLAVLLRNNDDRCLWN